MVADNLKPEYLSVIQSNISRMSTASALFKGFSATVLAGVVTVAFRDISPIVLLIMALPLLAFLMLDIYYLMLERKYRCLYSDVASGSHLCDFDMDISNIPDEQAGATIRRCIKSLSIVLFYGPVLLAFVILVVMRFAGIS